MAAKRPRAGKPTARSESLPEPYHIFIRDLVIEALVGVYPHEHRQVQPIRVNVELEVRGRPDPRRDDIRGVLSYEQVIAGIKAVFAAGHISLVETVAERIAELCLADARVLAARITVEKLRVEPLAAGAGVAIRRSRQAHG